MDTVGSILKAAREEKGVTLREIAMQTKMGMKYLTAIEEDRFEIFPSETHVTGFIRNYARYLDQSPEELIDIYKRIVMQETPAPLEELTAPTRSRINPGFFMFLGVMLAVILLIIFLLSRPTDQVDNNQGTQTSSRTYRTGGDKEITRFFKEGDRFDFKIGNDQKRLLFEAVSNNTVLIKLMNTHYLLRPGEKKVWDFNGDGFSELKVLVNSISNKNFQATVSQIPERIGAAPGKNQTDNDGTIKGNTILRSQDKVEINLTIKAKGFSILNIVKDDQERSSHTLKEGDTIKFLARNTILVKASNPFNLVLELNGKTLEIITRTPVTRFLFKWRRNPADGMWHLEYEKL